MNCDNSRRIEAVAGPRASARFQGGNERGSVRFSDSHDGVAHYEFESGLI